VCVRASVCVIGGALYSYIRTSVSPRNITRLVAGSTHESTSTGRMRGYQVSCAPHIFMDVNLCQPLELSRSVAFLCALLCYWYCRSHLTLLSI